MKQTIANFDSCESGSNGKMQTFNAANICGFTAIEKVPYLRGFENFTDLTFSPAMLKVKCSQLKNIVKLCYNDVIEHKLFSSKIKIHFQNYKG